MDARCYRGAAGRTKYIELTLDAGDAVGLLVVGLLVACTVAISSLL
jgi:energy-coupling factor transporter transmembrane protein EcfT